MSAHVQSRDQAAYTPLSALELLERLAPWLLALAMLVAAAMFLHFTQGMSFFFDDWNYVVERRPWDLYSFLAPHNQALTLTNAALYKILLATTGTSYTPFRVAITVQALLLAGLIYAYARPRVGGSWALIAVLPLLFYGAGAEAFLWPDNTVYLSTLIGLVGCLLAMDRGTRAGDILACAMLAFSMASSASGIAVLAVVTIEVLARPDRRSRWFIFAIPALLYALWWLLYHEAQPITLENAAKILQFSAEGNAFAMGGLFTLSSTWGVALVIGAIALAAHRALMPKVLTPRLTALLILPVAYWALIALGRAERNEPNSARYLFFAAVLFVLAACELGKGARLRDLRVAVPVLTLLVLVLGGDVLAIRAAGRSFRNRSILVAAEVGATNVARGVLAPSFEPDSVESPSLLAGHIYSTERELGALGWSLNTLRTGPVKYRIAADTALQRMEPLQLRAAPRRCSGYTLTPTGQISLYPGSGIRVRPTVAVAVHLRRFSPVFGSPVAFSLPAAGSVLISAPHDQAPDPWKLQFSGTVTICK